MSAPELGASEISAPPAGVAHLLTADDALAEGNRCGTYLAVCGALVPALSLPSSLCPPGYQCDCALYCPQCIREVLRDTAESGKRNNEPQGDEPESGESFFVGECDPGPQNHYIDECGATGE